MLTITLIRCKEGLTALDNWPPQKRTMFNECKPRTGIYEMLSEWAQKNNNVGNPNSIWNNYHTAGNVYNEISFCIARIIQINEDNMCSLEFLLVPMSLINFNRIQMYVFSNIRIICRKRKMNKREINQISLLRIINVNISFFIYYCERRKKTCNMKLKIL